MFILSFPARLVRGGVRTGILAALLVALLGSLSACGQRGPLYLPNPDAPNSSGKK